MNESYELPADLAPAVHILEPGPHWPSVLALLLALLFWWWRQRQKKPQPEASPTPRPAPPIPRTVPGIAGEIDSLRARYEGDADFRLACHELASLLRGHFHGRFRSFTANEISRALGETSVADVFELLAELQFRRREPQRDDFHGICDLAKENLGGEAGR